MELFIGEKIKKIRQQRGLTQEEVALHLGISFQAISKWERGDGYPEITMLPALSQYFNISIDELIGMNEINKAGKLNEINQLWAENNKNSLHPENVQLMREALRDYPNNELLLVQLATSLQKLDGSEAERASYLNEAIAVQEQILRYGEDSEIRGATLYNICYSYWRNKQYEKAVEQARKLPNLYKTQENALVDFLSGKEKHDIAKEALNSIFWVLSHHLKALAETERCNEYLNKLEGIREILFGGDDAS